MAHPGVREQLEERVAAEGPVVGIFQGAGAVLNALRAEGVCADDPWHEGRGQAYNVLDPQVLARLERLLKAGSVRYVHIAPPLEGLEPTAARSGRFPEGLPGIRPGGVLAHQATAVHLGTANVGAALNIARLAGLCGSAWSIAAPITSWFWRMPASAWFAEHHTVQKTDLGELRWWASHEPFAAAALPSSLRGVAFAILAVLVDIPVRAASADVEAGVIASAAESLDGLHTQRGRRPAKAGEWARLIPRLQPRKEVRRAEDRRCSAGLRLSLIHI